jgi:hypothetical protein
VLLAFYEYQMHAGIGQIALRLEFLAQGLFVKAHIPESVLWRFYLQSWGVEPCQ